MTGRLPSGWWWDAVDAGHWWVAIVRAPHQVQSRAVGRYGSMIDALSAAHRAALIASLEAWDAARYAAWARADPALFENSRK
jgi:hypothetical protein